jgi:hypothetical protein
VQLTVTTPGGGSLVEFQYCDASQVPVFLAYQDGTGAWQPVTATTSGGVTRFTFTLSQARGGVLAVFRYSTSIAGDALLVRRAAKARPMPQKNRTRYGVADAYGTEVHYASTSELAQDGVDNCALTRATKTVNGTVAGIPAGALGIVSLGESTNIFDGGAAPTPVTFDGVQAGLVDLVGTRVAVPGTPPNKAVVIRNLNVPDGGSLPSTIDFNGAASFVPASANATITGGAGDDLEVYTELVTANGATLMWADLAPSPTATRPWAGLNAATMVGGDFHSLVVFATPSGSDDYRVSLKYVGPVSNQSVPLGPALSAPTTSQIAGGAYPRFRFQGMLPAEYDKGAAIDVAGDFIGNNFSIMATGAYLAAAGGALVYDLTMPDVSGLAGFPAAARLTAGPNRMTASGFGFTGTGIFDVRPSVGAEFKAASKSVTISVP